MPFLDHNNQPLDPRRLAALGKREAEERKRKEDALILAAQIKGDLDENGNPTRPEEWETDPDFHPEEVPAALVHEGNGQAPKAVQTTMIVHPTGCQCEKCLARHRMIVEQPTAEETLSVLSRLLDGWAGDEVPSMSHEDFLAHAKNILANPERYRLEE